MLLFLKILLQFCPLSHVNKAKSACKTHQSGK